MSDSVKTKKTALNANSLAGLFKINPIVIKDMRCNMRGPRAFLLLTGYLLALGALAYGLYRITLALTNNYYGFGNNQQSAYIGQILFIGLAYIELLFVSFITPALTAGSISNEQERLTYDMLLATPLRPARILWGKMFASLTYIQMLILAAIPLFSIVFLFGGVSLRDIVQTIGLLVLTSITYGSIGVFFSALLRRTGRATVMSYLVVLFLMFGTLFIYGVILAASNYRHPILSAILYANPLSALASALSQPGMYDMGIMEIFSIVGGTGIMFDSNTDTEYIRPIWQYTVVIYSILSAGLYLINTQLVKPTRRWHIKRRQAVPLTGLLVMLAAGLWITFGTQWANTMSYVNNNQNFRPEPMMQQEVDFETIPDIQMMPTPVPIEPTATPQSPDPYLPEEHQEELANYLASNIMPVGKNLCDLLVLGEPSDTTDVLWSKTLYVWAHCKSYQIKDGALSEGFSLNQPVIVQLFWENENWEISSVWSLTVHEILSDEIQAQLLQNPYDEASGDARLAERAQQTWLGE